MSRIVDPVFADIRWEDGQITWRGYAALVKALTLNALLSLPGWAAEAWTDEAYALPRAAGVLIVIALLAAIPLLAPPLMNVKNWNVVPPATLVMTLLPQAIVLTLPTSLLLAVSLVLRPLEVNWRLIRRTALLSLAVVAANFAVVFYAVPDANQSFREAVVHALPATAHVRLERGPMEMDQSSLKRQIATLKRTPEGQASARRLEYIYQLRLAIVTAAIPLGLAGLAVSRRGSRRALSIIGVIIGYWTLMAFAERTVNALIAGGGSLPEYLCAWAPNAILLIAASALLFRRFPIQPLSASRDA